MNLDLGIIGNCQYSALINKSASVVWLCWPRFDSSSVFGSLIDETQGGEFSIQPDRDFTSTQNYIRNTNILRTVFETAGGSFEVIDFAPRFQNFGRLFHPNMLIRMVRPMSGDPLIKVNCDPRYDYGRSVPKAYWGSNHIQYEGLPDTLRLTTNAPLTYINEQRPFVLSRPLYFVMTWGNPLEAPLKETCENFFEHTKTYWQTWVKHCAIPDRYQDEVIRSALVLKLHQYQDTGAITAATTTSIPEYDGSGRNWDYRYCWLRDAYFTLSAFRHLGQFQEMESFVEYLRNIAENSGTSRLQPVYRISGDGKITEEILDHLSGYRNNKPVRIGNQAFEHVQNDIYGEMILAISPLFLDRRFNLEDVSPPKLLLEKLLRLIESHMEEKDAGLWEYRNAEDVHTFSLLMHWSGSKTAAEIGKRIGDANLVSLSQKLENQAKKIIDSRCWSKKLGAYTEAAGSEYLDASLFSMINMGFLEKDHPHAESHLRALEKKLKTKGDLVHRYVHDDDFGAPKTTFTICSFWYAEALARMGRGDEACRVFEGIVKHTNHLGLLSEDIHPETSELWGNYPQTYSHVGLINAAFQLSAP